MIPEKKLKEYLNINCKLIEFWYYNTFGEKNRKTFPHLTQGKVLNFPIYQINNINQQPFINLVDQILIDKKASSKPDSGSQNSSRVLEDKIDLMVYKLYELTYEEVKIVDTAFALSKEEYEQDLS